MDGIEWGCGWGSSAGTDSGVPGCPGNPVTRHSRSRGLRARAALLCAAVVLQAGGVAATARAQEEPQVAARIQVLVLPGEDSSGPSSQPALARADMAAHFYRERDFRPAWRVGSFLLPDAAVLEAAVQAAANHGLRPEEYHLEELQRARRAQQRGESSSNDDWAVQDVLLTDAFLTLADHLDRGRLAPLGDEEGWEGASPGVDLVEVLAQALAWGWIREALDDLAPSDPGYRHLCEALAAYRSLQSAGGWEPLEEGPTLHRGDLSPRVSLLRRRLFDEGYLPSPQGTQEMDEPVERAVRAYQARNGLDADGIVGGATRAALDIPVAVRIAQLEANLERWRWRGDSASGRQLRVNTAAFRLEAVEEGRVVLDMAVVVGTPENPTPAFTGRLNHLVLSPSWNVPPQIAKEEFLPELRRDPLYLTRKGFQVLRGWSPEVVVDAASVDWTSVSLDREGYHFRQPPGQDNALGRIKFLFPNRFHVYLHDTPARRLFAKARRDFSHGCIRVADPVRLAEYLLAADSRWHSEALGQALAEGVERIVILSDPIPVHVEYFTAWADDDGAVHFRADIYGRDEPLVERLRSAPPTT